MSRFKVNKHISKRQRASSHSIIETALKAAFLMLCTGLVVLLISAALCLRSPSPLALSRPLALFSLFIGVLAGGFLCGKRLDGASGYVSAAVATVLLAVLMLISKLFLHAPAERNELLLSVILHLATIFASLSGALVARNSKLGRRRKKSHYRS